MNVRRVLTSLGLVGALAGAADAQAPAVGAIASVPGSEITISLITFGSGDVVFERFGHNALRFQDAISGEDVAYHWGLFSFTEPGFLVRFLTGETNYWMGAEDARALIESNVRRGRHATVQRLNLTPAQALKLREFVRWNALDENKFYRYDYYLDNCSTRLRDAIDRALGGALQRVSETGVTPLTYRRESVRLTTEPVRLGIDVALGRPADVMLTEWASYFIPMRLRDGLRSVKVAGPGGTEVPLVASEQVVALPAGVAAIVELESSPRLAWRYGFIGLLLAAFVVGLRVMMISRPGTAATWGLAIFGSLWSLVNGVFGVILLLAWAATKHHFWAWNETALLLSPVSLVLAVLIPPALLRGTRARAARMVGAIVVALGMIALLLAIIPGGQENRALVALLLPVHLAIAWALALSVGALQQKTT